MLIFPPSLACALRRSCPLSCDACPAPAEVARTGYIVEKRRHAIGGGQQVSSPFLVRPSGAYAVISNRSYWCQPSPVTNPLQPMLPKPCMHPGYLRTLEQSKKLYFFDTTPLHPAISTPHWYLCMYLNAQANSQIQLWVLRHTPPITP